MKRWFFPITRVVQADMHGCAIASTAAACGVTYHRARSEFFPRRAKFVDDASLCVTQDQMLAAIDRLGFRSTLAPRFLDHRVPALVPFSWAPTTVWSGIHCVLWNPFERRFIDPGPDHDFNHDSDYYLDLWKRSNYQVILVTGRK